MAGEITRQGADHSPATLRLALISTPRSGNTWLRHLLANLYGVPEFAVHTPGELDWEALPPECLVQLHWRRTAPFLQTLERFGFRALILARHPLDVLLSVLQFALRDRSTLRWLDGSEGGEQSIYGAMPCSQPFLEYAAGPRAAALLAVSREWWDLPGGLPFRYESLVADPHGELERIAAALGVAPRRPVAEAVAASTLVELRARTRIGHHFWQGQPGLWRRLLPPDEARHVAAAQRASFDGLGYACDPDPELDRGRADAAWVDLVGPSLAEGLQLRQQLNAAETRCAAAEARCAALEQACAAAEQAHDRAEQCCRELTAQLEGAVRGLADLDARFAACRESLEAQVAAAQRHLDEVTGQLDVARRRLAEVEGIHPLPLDLARRLSRWSARHPQATRLLKRFLPPRLRQPAPPEAGADAVPPPRDG